VFQANITMDMVAELVIVTDGETNVQIPVKDQASVVAKDKQVPEAAIPGKEQVREEPNEVTFVDDT
jgi:hypothetical protein